VQIIKHDGPYFVWDIGRLVGNREGRGACRDKGEVRHGRGRRRRRRRALPRTLRCCTDIVVGIALTLYSARWINNHHVVVNLHCRREEEEEE
jgi:hypothetical protein